MATLASTNITSALAANNEKPTAWGDSGLIVEFFKCAGGAVGDTVALTPTWITDIRIVSSNQTATDTLSQTAANTNVTLTLTASAATNVTFQAFIIGRRS